MSGTNIQFFRIFLFLSLFILPLATAQLSLRQECPGPLRYYADLGCKPTYKNLGDRCAIKYDCTHLHQRLLNKCYANGTEYDIGERLNDEDRVNPCDVACFCSEGINNVAKWVCAIVDCPPKQGRPGCYFKRRPNSCCGADLMCPNPEEPVECKSGDEIYKEGDYFYPEDSSNVLCQCLPGYNGENVAPFCKKVACTLRHQGNLNIQNHCAPIYRFKSSPVNSCSYDFRCQNENDSVIKADKPLQDDQNDSKVCKLGNLELHIGDELSQSTESGSECHKCKCEVPPILTCKQLPQEDCQA